MTWQPPDMPLRIMPRIEYRGNDTTAAHENRFWSRRDDAELQLMLACWCSNPTDAEWEALCDEVAGRIGSNWKYTKKGDRT